MTHFNYFERVQKDSEHSPNRKVTYIIVIHTLRQIRTYLDRKSYPQLRLNTSMSLHKTSHLERSFKSFLLPWSKDTDLRLSSFNLDFFLPLQIPDHSNNTSFRLREFKKGFRVKKFKMDCLRRGDYRFG